ncbi:MAG: hypothetical protein IT357_15935 [Gemmatimonadaceae bacterium]|nr:hypothetical protein [Gemmatimonadaceae bacterium]
MTEYRDTHDVTDERHRADCAECTTVWAELEQISAAAAALPVLTPSRDLWAGIDARLDTRVAAPLPTRWSRSTMLRVALAASMLIAVTSGITWQLATSAADSAPAIAAVSTDADRAADGAPSTIDGIEPSVRLVKYDEEFRAMDTEIAAMQRLLETRRSTLDSATVAVLERNLAVIDTAIAESRAALLKDPASQFLATQLSRSYTSKLTLLRASATMPAGI